MLALGVVGASLALPRQALAEPACRPAVIVDGEPELVAKATAQLRRRGFASTAPSGCPVVRAKLSRDNGEIVVDVSDPVGRRSQRKVTHVSEAVSVIHSWARPNLNADLMAGFMPKVRKPVVTRPRPEVRKPLVAMPAPARPKRDVVSLSVLANGSIDWGAGLWAGVGATACAPLGPFCVGGSARYLSSVSETPRSSVDVLGIVSWPKRFRHLTLAPGVGIGAGRLASASGAGVGALERVRWGLRADAHLVASYAVTDWLLVDIVLAADVSPFAAEAQNQNQMQVPAEPRGFLRGGLGLRLGAI